MKQVLVNDSTFVSISVLTGRCRGEEKIIPAKMNAMVICCADNFR